MYYGYRIENGSVVIDESQADIIRRIFQNYLSGMALEESAKQAGISLYHGTVKKMLCNRTYLGTPKYPAVIDADTFEKANAELKERALRMNRYGHRKTENPPVIATEFSMKKAQYHHENPFTQAEYLYTLIERKGGTWEM